MSGPEYRTALGRLLPAGLKFFTNMNKVVPGTVFVMGLAFLLPISAHAQMVPEDGNKQIIIESSGTPLTVTTLGAPSDTPRTLKLAIGRAQLMRLPVDVKDIIVSSSAVADVVVKSPRLVYMLGQQSGSTSVIMLDADSNIIYNMNIVVAQELSTLQTMLKTVLPDENISVTSVQGNILMTGKVRTS